MSRPCPAPELLTAAQAGDRKAQGEVVKASLWIVAACVKRSKRPELRDDLTQAGLVGEGGTGGLMGAISTWNPAVGANFWTHATHHIWGAMRRELATNQSTEGLATKREMTRRRDVKRRHLKKQHGREPTVDELSEAVGANPKVVELSDDCIASAANNGNDHVRSVLLRSGRSDALSLSDGMSGPRMVDKLTARRAIELMPETLTDIEQRVIEAHAIEGRTFTDIGAEIGLSREWARHHYLMGCARLRAVLEE